MINSSHKCNSSYHAALRSNPGFKLELPLLAQLASIINFLDVGGTQPPEAHGIERVLAGLHETISDDHQLLATASNIFNGACRF